MIRLSSISCSILLTVFITNRAAHAQSFSIDRFKVAGGGGVSSGGGFSLSDTIGQLDASGPLTGGNYSLTGGFWALDAIQTPGAPLLRIFMTATNTAIVAWPTNSGPFSLQQNSSLGSVNWINVTNIPTIVGNENQVVVSPLSGFRFYRLKYP